MVRLASHRSQDSRRWSGRGGAPAAITFDFTHTLAHSPRRAAIYSEVLRRHGLVVRVRDLEHEIPRVWQEFSCLADPRRDRFTAHPRGAQGWWSRFLVRLCERLDLDEPSRFAAAELYDRFVRADAWEVYPDVVPTLGALRDRGLRLGLVSNWDPRLPRVLANLGLDRFFEAVEYSSGCGIEKPHPEIFQRCLASLKVTPARALHVGDSTIEDVEGALGVGMRAMRVDRRDSRSHLGRILTPLVTALLILLLVCCRGPADDRPAEVEAVDVPPLLTVDLEQDLQEAARTPDLAGVLPGDFPRDLPLYSPSSLIDFGETEAGQQYVVLLSPHPRPRVASELEVLLRKSGWVVESGPSGSRWLRKGSYRVHLVFEDSRPGARYRFEY